MPGDIERKGQKNNRGNVTRKKKGGKIAFFLLSLVLVAYLGVAVYFTKHFLFNTYVNEIPAYNLTAADIEKAVVDELKNYKLTINSRGGLTDVISSDDIQLTLQMDDQFTEALKQLKPFAWPKYLFTETYLTTDNIVVYSDDVLSDFVDGLSVFSEENIKAPVDAHLSEEAGDDGFYVVAEDPGQTPLKEKVKECISSALDVLEPEVTLGDDCYLEAGIKSDDVELGTLCENLNKYCKAKILYQFGEDEIVVDGVTIRELCDIDGTNVALNKDKVRDFVNSLARKYDTFGKTRTLINHEGEEVVIEGGDYGWWMDRGTETSELMEAISSGEQTTRTPVYFGTAAEYGDTDWGDSYVEVDLSAQHLWVYDGGRVVEESDFVSGCVNLGRTTPRGTYGITYKERDATLVGENYSSPVKYWMPFNGNVGMHDASWRSEFGGELYVAGGSHGCLNLPTDKAASIFDIVSKGEAVLVYGGKTVPEPVPEENPDGMPVEGAEGVQGLPEAANGQEGAPADSGAATPAETVPADNGATQGEQTPAETTENLEEGQQ
ncbi:MAG: hypothetical protein E7302_01375 [Butyrivibrio sp.]|nr:hypothetical protein [Butyrivibrio sp.]